MRLLDTKIENYTTNKKPPNQSSTKKTKKINQNQKIREPDT